MNPKDVVIEFWKTMETNDFTKAGKWLSDDFECFWPQSSELIVGRNNFIGINNNYPSNGIWRFTINSIVTENNTVVTDVSVTDGVITARAITFHIVENGKIKKQIEYWPDNYEAPEWRKNWVKIIK